MREMFYETEYPLVYSASKTTLDILTRPIIWFKPLLSTIGQFIYYRYKIKPMEVKVAETMFDKKILKMEDGTEIMLAISCQIAKPKAIVMYLHTVCGTYEQLAHFAHMLKGDGLAYISYTRSGNDSSLIFNKFNFVGRIEELQAVIRYLSIIYPDVPIHVVGASAGSALLIKYLGKYNSDKIIKSAVLVSPGYNFMKSIETMNGFSKAYLVNKMKYMIRNLPCKEELKSVKTMEDWLTFQSRLLGYSSNEEYVKDCDPFHYLQHINVPTLCISALDDNIFDGKITKEFIDLPSRNPNITLVVTKRGGHVLFEDNGYDMPWFLRVTHEWLKQKIGYI